MKDFIYFDTCVLLDNISFRQGFVKFNLKKKFDIGQINPLKAEVFISDILLIEIAEKLKDSLICKKAISEGYSYFDLNKQNLDNFELVSEDLKTIENIIKSNITNLPSVVSPKNRDFSSNEINNLMDICNKYSIFFIDALHFLIAEREGCNIFVTSDKKLEKGLKKFLYDTSSEKDVYILSPNIFKNKYLKNLI